MTCAVLPVAVRVLLGDRLPDWLDARFAANDAEMAELAPLAEIGWFDSYDKAAMRATIDRAVKLRWLNSVYAGVDHFPLDVLAARQTVVTNGKGINAIAIAEWVVMGMLTVAKGYARIVEAAARREWLTAPQGTIELADTRALIVGAGAIGQAVAKRLVGLDVAVTLVRRVPAPGELGPDDWRVRLLDFDWIVLAVPATTETEAMIGAVELAAMKRSAVLLNIARGSVVDQAALVAALAAGDIHAAFLDVTTPEPLPVDHRLWTLPNAFLTMHLSGPSQNRMFERAAMRFVDNLDRWHRGLPLRHSVDLILGY